jgi:hypothetical protein
MRRVKKLEKEVHQLKDSIEELKDELWKVKNPPEFEFGDDIEYDCDSVSGKGKIIGVDFDKVDIKYFDFVSRRWIYTVYGEGGLTHITSNCSSIKKY